MKKIFAIACLFVSITSCHYGQEDAKKTLDTNEQYKNEKSDYSTNRGNDGVQPEHHTAVEQPVSADSISHTH